MKKITRATCDLDTRDIKDLIHCLKVFRRYGFTKDLSVNVSPSGKGHHVTSWSDKDKGVSLKKLIKIRRKAGDDSVSEDTLLYWKENGKLRFSRIIELYKSFKEGNKIEVLTAKIKKKKCRNKNLRNFITPSYTDIVWGKITNCWHKGKRQIYRILLVGGNYIEITENHSLFGRREGLRGITNKIIPLKLHEIRTVAIIEKEILDHNLEEALVLFHKSSIFKIFSFMDGPIILYEMLEKYQGKTLTSREIYSEYRQKYGIPSKNDKGTPTRDTLNTWLEAIEKSGFLIKEKPIKKSGWQKWRIEKYKKADESELKELLILCGLWLADGCYDHGHAINISTGDNIEIIRWLEQYCKNIKNIHNECVKINVSQSRKGDLRIHSSQHVKIMKYLGFIGKSTSKRIPDFIFTLPNEYISQLLRGYFSGDGCLSFSHNVPIIGIDSISKDLIYGTKILLSKLGIESTIHSKIRQKGFGNKKSRMYYVLSIQQRNSVRAFLQKIGLIKKYNKNLYIINGGKKNFDIYLRKIKNIEYIGEKDVYDIEIKPTESFVANGILCHNSTRCDLDTWGSGQRMINVLFTGKKRKKLKAGDVVFDEQDMQVETCGSEDNVKISFGET